MVIKALLAQLLVDTSWVELKIGSPNSLGAGLYLMDFKAGRTYALILFAPTSEPFYMSILRIYDDTGALLSKAIRSSSRDSGARLLFTAKDTGTFVVEGRILSPRTNGAVRHARKIFCSWKLKLVAPCAVFLDEIKPKKLDKLEQQNISHVGIIQEALSSVYELSLTGGLEYSFNFSVAMSRQSDGKLVFTEDGMTIGQKSVSG